MTFTAKISYRIAENGIDQFVFLRLSQMIIDEMERRGILINTHSSIYVEEKKILSLFYSVEHRRIVPLRNIPVSFRRDSMFESPTRSHTIDMNAQMSPLTVLSQMASTNLSSSLAPSLSPMRFNVRMCYKMVLSSPHRSSLVELSHLTTSNHFRHSFHL